MDTGLLISVHNFLAPFPDKKGATKGTKMADPKTTLLRWRTSYKYKNKKQGIIVTLYVNGKRVGDVGALYEGGYADDNIKEWGWQAFATHAEVPAMLHQSGYKTVQGAKRALAGHVARALFGVGENICCPKCGGGNIAVVDTIQEDDCYSPIRYVCYARLSCIEDDGTMVPEGYTDTFDAPNPCWDTQQPRVNKHGYYMLGCRDCATEWYDPRVHYGEGGGAFGDLDRDP